MRTYRYVVDHTGAVHLDEPARARTLATAYRDPKFLDDLYRGLRRRRDGRWTQRCAGEINVLRADTGDAPNAASLEAIAGVVDEYLPELKKLSPDATITRMVCGGCLDFKLMTTVPLDTFGPWEEKGFAPEADFLAKLKAIDGVSQVETQTITNMVL